MARSRNKSNRTQAVVTATQETPAPNTNTNNTKERNTMSALDMAAIQELLAGSRTKGAGTEVIQNFLDGGNPAEEVDLSTGPLAGKEPGQAYTTLQNAKKRTTTDSDGSTKLANPEFRNVRVIKRNQGTKDAPDFHIYLIDLNQVSVA